MKTRDAVSLLVLQLGCVLFSVVHAELPLAPELTHRNIGEWFNSPPLTLASLRGAPVLVEFWTFDCINCRHSIDWMKSIEQRKANNGLTIVSVHTPELANEKRTENVRVAIDKLGIHYPVMLDTDYSYWSAMNNKYWPAFYLIDAQGRIAAKHFGELRVGEKSTAQFEQEIDRLLGAATNRVKP